MVTHLMLSRNGISMIAISMYSVSYEKKKNIYEIYRYVHRVAMETTNIYGSSGFALEIFMKTLWFCI